MSENKGEGISRRDLLRKGAVLGGAVVWATPVVQTLGMGRAYAQTASPTGDGGKDISYIGIMLTGCPEVEGPPPSPEDFFVKWEDGEDPPWEMSPGAVPSCAEKDSLPVGLDGMGLGFIIRPIANDPSCKELFIPGIYEACDDIIVWVKGGSESSTSEPCNVFTGSALKFDEFFTVCTA